MGKGENHQLSAAPSWGSAEKGLSLPVPLFSFCLFQIPGCCGQFKPLTEKYSKFSNILHYKAPGTASCPAGCSSES